jgi:mannose-6-phosphate isomerase
VEAYPLLTEPHFQDYIWGGRNLERTLNKRIPAEGVWAESWEIVDHAEHQSRIANGPLAGKNIGELAREHSDWLVGRAGVDQVPLLLKYLDCNRVLSVQVHPEDVYAQKMTPPDLGKTEAWYVMSAEPGAVLYAGLKDGVTAPDLAAALATGSVEDCLNQLHPSAGDCVFIPAGTVHALGEGLLVAEIQQASNTTFRLFDWNRLGGDGQPRELHIEQALEVIDFEAGPSSFQAPKLVGPQRERLVACDKFLLDRVTTNSTAVSLDNAGEMHFVTVPEGSITMTWEDAGQSRKQDLSQGQSCVLPAAMSAAQITSSEDTTVLLMRLP